MIGINGLYDSFITRTLANAVPRSDNHSATIKKRIVMKANRLDMIARKDGRLQLGKLILLFVLAGLLALTLSRPYMTLTGAFPLDEARGIRQVGYLILIALAALGAWLDKRFTRFAALPLPFILVLLWCGLSVLWSPALPASFTRLFLTSAVVWIAFICVDRVGVRRSLFLMRGFLALVLLINYIFVLFYPNEGIHSFNVIYAYHQWRGAMSHKNIAGSVAAITILVFVFHGARASRLPRYAVAFAAAVFLGFTQSRTSIIGTMIALAVGAITYRSGSRISDHFKDGRGGHTRWIGLILCILAGITLILLTLNGRLLLDITADPSLWSGRGEIWQSMLVSYFENPALGSGYGAFWAQPQDVAHAVNDASRFSGVTQGHNGYLDLAIQVGLPGLLLALVAVVVWPVTTVIHVLQADISTSALVMAIQVFFIANNASETSLFDGDQIPQVFAMLALAMLAATIRRRKAGLRHESLAVSVGHKPPRQRRRRPKRNPEIDEDAVML